MASYSEVVEHIETGKCVACSDTTRLLDCLGKWWYSALYMDLDIHAQIRTGRIELKEMREWIAEDLIEPFICRAPGCGRTFAKFSSLVTHYESRACNWDVSRLNMPGLEKEMRCRR